MKAENWEWQEHTHAHGNEKTGPDFNSTHMHVGLQAPNETNDTGL